MLVLQFFEVSYAEIVKKNGFFTGLLDLALLAQSRKKRLMVLHYDDSGEDPQAVPLMDILRPLYGSSELPPPEDMMHVGGKSDTWYCAAILAEYAKGSYQQLNHFVPLFHKDTMGELLWSKLTHESASKHAKRIQKYDAMLPGEDESDDEFAASAREHLALLLRQQEFGRLTESMDLLATAVPGDGNCGLWIVISLEGGPIAKCQGVTVKTVHKMREDAWYLLNRLFILSSTFPRYQMMFNVFFTKTDTIPLYPTQ